MYRLYVSNHRFMKQPSKAFGSDIVVNIMEGGKVSEAPPNKIILSILNPLMPKPKS